jgi:hypothetical protein
MHIGIDSAGRRLVPVASVAALSKPSCRNTKGSSQTDRTIGSLEIGTRGPRFVLRFFLSGGRVKILKRLGNRRSPGRGHAQPQTNWCACSNVMSPARLPRLIRVRTLYQGTPLPADNADLIPSPGCALETPGRGHDGALFPSPMYASRPPRRSGSDDAHMPHSAEQLTRAPRRALFALCWESLRPPGVPLRYRQGAGMGGRA